MSYFLLIISAIFVNNIVLAQFLGICPFLGVSKKIDTSLGMGAAVMFVMTIATICTYLLDNYVLQPLGVQYLQTISYILVIAASCRKDCRPLAFPGSGHECNYCRIYAAAVCRNGI